MCATDDLLEQQYNFSRSSNPSEALAPANCPRSIIHGGKCSVSTHYRTILEST